MFAEYALDPSLLSNWQDFRFFVSQFGASRGRLISRFPKSWKGMVKEAAKNAGEVEFLKIVEALNRLDDAMLIREYDYQKNHLWLRNALEENAKRPFHAIVSSGAQNNSTNYVDGTAIDPTAPPALWIVPASIRVARQPQLMADCVTAILTQCSEVIFVDPYFGPGKINHTEPLKCFLKAIAKRGSRAMPTRVEYHTGNQDRGTAQFQKDLERWIKPHLPPSVALSVVRWNKDELHNRYIVTNRGGVMFGHGLDQAGAGSITHDTVSLLDEATCCQLMTDYSDQSSALTWINEVFTVKK